MIWVVCRISFERLLNNRQELLVTFAVPLLFFSIFAFIFSRGVSEPLSRVRVAFVDDDRTRESQHLIQQASQRPEIHALPNVIKTHKNWPINSLAKLLLTQHGVEVVVYVPPGFTSQNPDAPTLSIQLFEEGSNPIGPRLVQAGLAESIAMELSRVNLLSSGVMAPPEPSTPPAPDHANNVVPANYQSKESTPASPATSSAVAATSTGASNARVEQVFQSISPFTSAKHQPKIALYAAGIAVMFLLFSAGSAGGTLLDERESGTLGRLLSSRLTIAELLMGKWLFLTILGFAQTTLMFVWGQLVFQVDLVGHLPGFLVMTLFTSAACASFGLALAAACSSRQQLGAVSMVVILCMSAIGGSMVPRYVMSATMKSLGKLTFNGWALDGYQKIFWYDLPVRAIAAEVLVLTVLAMVLSAVAYVLAQRWKLA